MKSQKIKPYLADVSKVVVEKVAQHYANVVCPFFTYQPKVPDSLKKKEK